MIQKCVLRDRKVTAALTSDIKKFHKKTKLTQKHKKNAMQSLSEYVQSKHSHNDNFFYKTNY